MSETPALFREYEESAAPWTGTFWWGEISDLSLPSAFFEAAHRLMRSADDGEGREPVLLPILYMYRHAIEQLLKRIIHEAAALRRIRGDSDESLTYVAVQIRLEKRIRHDIRALLAEIDGHLGALGSSPLSDKSLKLLRLLVETDNRGNSFRFSGQLTNVHVSIALERLSIDLDAVYWELVGTVDYLDAVASEEQDWKAFLDDYVV